MPVSRNFSLPASIEGRMKKRAEILSRSNTDIPITSDTCKPTGLTLKSVNRPNFLPTANSNNNNDVVTDQTSIKPNESNEQVADSANDNEMGVDTTSTRGGTLSQPCLSVSSTIGATRIFPHLYLGSQKDVVDEDMMRSNGITYVLNVSTNCTKPTFIDDNHFHRISVRDSYQEKMTPYIREAIDFIEKVRKSNQRVIVHCLAGVSRSATVAIAYVLHYLRINFEDAYRFVKEKRPSISPNFNFLGQLMEFEKTLKATGHMNSKRTGSLSDAGDADSQLKFNCTYNDEESTNRASLRLNILKTRPECSPRAMPAACSFQCATPTVTPCQTASRVQTPVSSFCRRRNAPCFSKEAFTSIANGRRTMVDTPMPKLVNGSGPFEKSEPGLLVDLHVTVPATPRVSDASRRLGSDGNEMDENAPCDASVLSSDTFTSPTSPNSLFNHREQSMDCDITANDNERKSDDEKFAKPRTAPNTPVVGRFKSGRNSPWRPGQIATPKPASRHRRCASGGGGISSDILLSPFNMKRRLEPRTERSASIGDVSADAQAMEVDSCVNIKRGSSFSGQGSYYDHSEPSARSPHKFVSFNSRSPKILRKSFNLNLRPVYPHSNSSRGSAKSEGAFAPQTSLSVLHMDDQIPKFDCSHSLTTPTTEPLKCNVNRNAQNDDDMVISSMSPLRLSSPNTEKDGSVLFPSTNAKSPISPATCPILTSNVTSPDPAFSNDFDKLQNSTYRKTKLVSQASFTFSSSRTPSESSPEARPFLLSPGCDLQLRWRRRERRRQSADSGYLTSSQASSQASSSFTSPTSQQSVFGASQESFAGDGVNTDPHASNNNTCHAEGAFVADDVTNSNSDPETRKNAVGRRAAVEIMSCS